MNEKSRLASCVRHACLVTCLTLLHASSEVKFSSFPIQRKFHFVHAFNFNLTNLVFFICGIHIFIVFQLKRKSHCLFQLNFHEKKISRLNKKLFNFLFIESNENISNVDMLILAPRDRNYVDMLINHSGFNHMLIICSFPVPY